MKKKLAIAAVVLAAAGLITAGIAPAQATGAPTLPAGQKFFSLDNDDYVNQLFSVDASTAASTPVGTLISANSAGYTVGAQVNPVDGTVYFLTRDVSVIPSVTYLDTVDPTTGVVTRGPAVTGGNDLPGSLMITKAGVAYSYVQGTLNLLDLSTGVQTFIGSSSGIEVAGYDAVTDKAYGFSYRGGLAYTIDLTSGALTPDPAHNLTLIPYSCPAGGDAASFGLYGGPVFDGNGNPWFMNDVCHAELVVADFATGTTYFMGQFNSAATYPSSPNNRYYTGTLFITGTPTAAALPDTGASAFAIVSTGAIAAGLLGAGALALIMVRRRQAGK